MKTKITINIRGFQDTIETDQYESLNTIRVWHTCNGKDTLINTFTSNESEHTIDAFISNYISNFYNKDLIEII